VNADRIRGAPAPSPGRLAIGIDVGGSGIKGAAVDVESGQLRTERFRYKTPQPSTPIRCMEVMQQIVADITSAVDIDPAAPVGVGVPAVTIDGIILTATNIDDDWLGFDAGGGIADLLRRRTAIVNDADAAGLAEMRFGAGRGRQGTVLVLTLGTGVGSALFRNGDLVPNTELGHIEVRGKDAEHRASSAARERRKLSWKTWAGEVDEYLHHVDMLVWPDLIIIGGGVSKDADKFLSVFSVRPEVVAAQLRNEAGIVGAALVGAGLADIVPSRPTITADSGVAGPGGGKSARAATDLPVSD
jgi:polyphosphate glucokinase